MKKILLVIGLVMIFQTNAHAVSIDLGDAADFAVLGLDGGDVTVGSGATTINGDVGIGPNNTGDLKKATINGKLFVDPTATPDIHGDLIVTGGTFSQNLTQASNDAFAAWTAASALTSTQIFGDITTSTTITRDQVCNVIFLNSLDLVKDDLTLEGGPDDFFLFNISHGFSLSSGDILLSGGLPTGHVLFNFLGQGADKSDDIFIFKDVTTAHGTFLAPYRNVSLDKATLNGAILSGEEILVHSGAQLNYAPFAPPDEELPPVPEPGTLMLMSSGLLGLGFWRPRRKK